MERKNSRTLNGNQMAGNQNELEKFYGQLLNDVLELVDHTGKARKDSGGIRASSCKLIRNLIHAVVGRTNFITEKTIGNYYRDGYSDSRTLIGLFAAVALVKIYKGTLTEEACKIHYEDNPASSPEYWSQYIRLDRSELPEPAPEFNISDGQWEKDNTKKSLNIFPSPEYEDVFVRQATMNALLAKICRHRIIAVDGIAGCGKKHFIKAMEPMLLESARYDAIWWFELHKEYNINNFFEELPFETDGGVKGRDRKFQWLEEQLKANRILVVFNDIEPGGPDSFLPLFERAFEKPGDCRYLVLRNTRSLFPDIPPVNRLSIPPLSPAEIKSFLETDAHRISDDELEVIGKISGGWPFYLQAIRLNGSDKPSLKKVLKSPDLLNDDLSRWLGTWAKHLDQNSNKVLDVLFAYGRSTSHAELVLIAKDMGLSRPDFQIEQLQNAHLLTKDETENLVLTAMGQLYAKLKPDDGHGQQIHENICKMIQADLPSEPTAYFNATELDGWLEVIDHQQEAALFEQSGLLIGKIKSSLKRRNKYPLLIRLLMRQIKKETQQKDWFKFDLAHAYFITGEYKNCVQELEDCINLAKKWYATDNREAAGVSYFLKSIQLFAELCSAVGLNKQAISIFSKALSLFEYSEMNWTNRCHAISVLSQFYERDKKFEESLRMNENLLKGDFEHRNTSKAVALMRMGIAQRRQGNYTDANKNLVAANKLFRADKRGKAWSDSLLALDYLQAGNVREAKELIKQIINVHLQGSVANRDYSRWLTFLKHKSAMGDLHSFIDSELARIEITQINPGKEWLGKFDDKVGALSNWLQQRARNYFDIDAFIRPLRGSEIPPQSELRKSMDRKIRHQPLRFLERIAAIDAVQLFSDSHITEQVALCATDFECREFIRSRIITRHYKILCDPDLIPDTTRMEYGKILYWMGDAQQALELLDIIHQAKRGFNYQILKADCLAKCKIFNQADNIYETMLLGGLNNTEHAIVLYKHAKLMMAWYQVARFGDALEWAKKALILHNTEVDFVCQVENTIFYLTVETTPLESLEIQTNRLIELYSFSLPRGQNVAQQVSDVTKRRKLENILPKYTK
jgi:tetratricopeptide (TPR) repeat protein